MGKKSGRRKYHIFRIGRPRSRRKREFLPKRLVRFLKSGSDSSRIAIIMAVFLVCTAFAAAESVGTNGSGYLSGTEDSDQGDAGASGMSAGEEFLAVLSNEDMEEDDGLPGTEPADIAEADEDAAGDEDIFVEGPDILNLAYYYDEDVTGGAGGTGTAAALGAEDAGAAYGSDAVSGNDAAYDRNPGGEARSYADRAYHHIMSRNADLYSSFYNLSGRTPLSMAQSLGMGAERVTAGYNPTDSAHNAKDPSTWILDCFENVNVHFYNGDGSRIDGYYAAQEILSLASVYMYYHNDTSYEHFADYCDRLFDSAISYTVNMGEVYYDSGCLALDSDQEESWTELYGDGSYQENTDGDSIATPSDYTVQSMAVEESEDIIYIIEEDTEETGTDALSGAISRVQAEDTASDFVPDESVEETRGYAVFSSGTVESSKAYVDDDGNVHYNNAAASGEEASEGNGEDTASWFTDEEGTGYTSSDASGSGGYSEDEGSSVSSDSGSSGNTGTGDSPAAAAGTDSGSGTVTGGRVDYSSYVSWLGSLLRNAGIDTEAADYCPGHIDIYVNVTIRGINDRRNDLFSADSVGNAEENFNESWQGWTEEMRAYARDLSSQDWEERYGISVSSVTLSSELGPEEIEYYMSLIDEDTSELRRSIVRFALGSVGRVPYYWGGKPSGPGYEGNGFFRIIAADYEGRILKGLDCSGWINWVYWSVTGSSLPGQNTVNLVNCGRGISRSELKAGDIIVRLGEDAHVVMFISWNGDGTFTGIHESAGKVCNVNVARMTANWPYVRSLAD